MFSERKKCVQAGLLVYTDIQATVVVRALDVRGFILASIFRPRPNFKACCLHRLFSRLITKCDAGDKLSIREFWRQFHIRMDVVTHF
jgi:hypothetical protein